MKSTVKSHEGKTIKLHFMNGISEKSMVGKITQIRGRDFKFKPHGTNRLKTIKYSQVIEIAKPDHLFWFENPEKL